MASYESHRGRHIVKTPHPGGVAAFIYAVSRCGEPLRRWIEPRAANEVRDLRLKALCPPRSGLMLDFGLAERHPDS